MSKNKETRVYVLDCSTNDFDFRGKELAGDYEAIMTEAEKRGTVYSLEGFENDINDEELDLNNSFIYISNK